MSTHVSPASAGTDQRVAWSTPVPTSVTTEHLDVPVLRWPSEASSRATLSALRLPLLLVLEPGEVPPEDLEPQEDWVRWPPDPTELLLRAKHLASRSAPPSAPSPVELDDDGVLRRGDRWVSLSPAQAPIVRHLLDQADRVVPLDEVIATYRSAGGSDHPPSVRTVLSRIDAKVRPLGVRIVSIRRRGVVLRTGQRL